ncbi:MAG: transporter substrate-binding domain-containing diguanylate cyclase, partial [Gammaproteobacteria bacterium]
HPGIRIVQTAHARSGLEMVARGDVFGYLDTAATIGYQIQKHGLPNIRISGMTQESYAMSVAVRNDQPLLLGIFDKAVASLSESDKQAILNQWISVRFEQTIDYTQTWKVLISIAILLFLMAVREYIVSKYKARLVALNKELEQLSKTDSLTGIANRHLLNHVLHEEIARSQRYHSKFSIIMLDVDHFKSINDHFGHSEGDHILQSIAGCIADSTRVNDTAGRWGGEEFLILCPGTDLNGAVQLAEAMRQTIECHDFGLPSCVTVSLGVAEHHDNQSLESFIRLVDNALYEAKNEGRNQVKTVTL